MVLKTLVPIQVFSVFISDQTVTGKSNRNKISFFDSLGNPKGLMFDYFFMLKISVITSPAN